MKNNKKGFTLVELLVVVCILAILMAIAVPGILKISGRMKERGLNSKLEAIEEAAVIYVQENSNQIKKELQKKSGQRDCKNNSSICKCNPTNYQGKPSQDCKYYYTMTVKELIQKKAYKSENTKNAAKTCAVVDPMDAGFCLDCAVIYIELDDDHKNATAKIDRKELNTYRISKDSITTTNGATCP